MTASADEALPEEPLLGEPVTPSPDWRPPARTVMQGRLVRLEPIDPDRHAAALYEASKDHPEIWAYMPYGPFESAKALAAWQTSSCLGDDPLFFAVCEAESGRPLGMVSFLRIVPAMGVIEIGHIWFAATLQRTPLATEAIFLLMRRTFDEMRYRRLEWKCNDLNDKSKAAALRFGFAFEGVFRQHMILKGRNRDSAWFALLDKDWPRVRTNFAAWLDPANFDDAGRQKTSLRALNAAG